MRAISKYLFLILLVSSIVSSQENKSKFGVSINGGLGFPLGDFNEVYKMGFGFNTSIFYALEETTELGAVIGYFSWSFDNSKFNNAFKDAGLEGNFNVAAPIHVLPLLIQVKFKLPREDFNPYILIEGGIYYTSVQLSGTFTSPDTTITFDEPTIKNSEAGMSFGLGTEIPSSENLEFDIRLTYHLVPTVNIYNFGSIGYQKDVSTNKFISVVAGVNYLF